MRTKLPYVRISLKRESVLSETLAISLTTQHHIEPQLVFTSNEEIAPIIHADIHTWKWIQTRLSVASLQNWDIATEEWIVQSVMSLNVLTMLTQVPVTNRIADFSTLIERLNFERFQRRTPTIPRTGTSQTSAVNSQNPMERSSIPLPSMKRKSLGLKWKMKITIFRNKATSFLCEWPVSFRPLIFYPTSPLKFALLHYSCFSHWRLFGLLNHDTQMDGVDMKDFGVGVIVRPLWDRYISQNRDRRIKIEKTNRKHKTRKKKLLHVRVQDVYHSNTKQTFSWTMNICQRELQFRFWSTCEQ